MRINRGKTPKRKEAYVAKKKLRKSMGENPKNICMILGLSCGSTSTVQIKTDEVMSRSRRGKNQHQGQVVLKIKPNKTLKKTRNSEVHKS